MSFSKLQSSKIYNFDFRSLQQKQEQYLKENKWFTFQEELWWKRKENQIVNQWQPNPKLSMIVRTQSKPRSLLIQMKISFLKHKSIKKHQTLNFQSITDL